MRTHYLVLLLGVLFTMVGCPPVEEEENLSVGTVAGEDIPPPVSAAWWYANHAEQPGYYAMLADFPDACDVLEGYYTDYLAAWSDFQQSQDDGAVADAISTAVADNLPEEYWLATLVTYDSVLVEGAYEFGEEAFLRVSHQTQVPYYDYEVDGDLITQAFTGVDFYVSGWEHEDDLLEITYYGDEENLVGTANTQMWFYGNSPETDQADGSVNYSFDAPHCAAVEELFNQNSDVLNTMGTMFPI